LKSSSKNAQNVKAQMHPLQVEVIGAFSKKEKEFVTPKPMNLFYFAVTVCTLNKVACFLFRVICV